MQLLKRTMDATSLNVVANHAEVRPWLGGSGVLDLSGLVENPANVALVNDGGGFLFIKQEPGIYELHTQFLPSHRGPSFVKAAHEAQRYMFTATDCMEVLTKVPASNKGADFAAKAFGFTPRFEREAVWPETDGSLGKVIYYARTFDQWVANDRTIIALGHSFHDQLEAAKAEAGSARPTHPDAECHDRNVGAAVMMCAAGNVAKAVWAYNRWARFAGYEPLEILSLNPPIIDVRDAVVEVRDGRMEVLRCPLEQ